MKYQKKPVVIEAVQYTGGEQNTVALIDWIKGVDSSTVYHLVAPQIMREVEAAGGISIKTIEGTMIAQQGDWIIKGIKGEFYPCKPDIFAATYDSVAETSTDTFSFSRALELLKHGARVSRKGWNGKDMFVLLVNGYAVAESINACYGDAYGDVSVPVRDALYLYTTTNDLVAWVASQTDLLEDDWQIV